MFKRRVGGGQRLFEQCSKKLHFSYGKASLTDSLKARDASASKKRTEMQSFCCSSDPIFMERGACWRVLKPREIDGKL